MEISSEVVVKKPKRLTSVVWNHFERIKKADLCYAVCLHCNKRLSGSSNSGTTHLRNHLMRCLKRSNYDVSQLLAKRRKKENVVALPNYGFDEAQRRDDHIPVAAIKFDAEPKRDDVVTIASTKFDQERSRSDLARMIILHGYPLSMVEHVGFKMFVRNLQPLFEIVTNSTVELDCMTLYEKEKQKVYETISRLRGRVNVAVDVWNSPENARYLCMTAHYIDEEWKLQKRILNFIMIDAAHTEDIHSEVIIKCLMDWDIERNLFSMTFSDLFTSDEIVSRIKEHLSQNRPLLNSGRLFDIRCAADVLRLLVEDVMDALREVIHKIRDSIRYIKSSQIMQGKFNEFAQQVGIDNNERSLFLDCPLRWNSTSGMLETVLAYKAAFAMMQEHDPAYTMALTDEEWEWAGSVGRYLKLFVEITNLFTSNKCSTANLFFPDICEVHQELINWCKSSDEYISSLAMKMKGKFDIYWSKCSLSLAIAAVLDPRYKMKIVEYYYTKIYGDHASDHIKEVAEGVRELFNEYTIGLSCALVDDGPGNSAGGGSNESRDRLKGFDKFLHETSQSQSAVSDLDKYLEEPVFPRNFDFNIFNWWKVHMPRYPILSMMARDVISVPMSTIASESSYRTGGRVLDQYRSSLSPDTVQALVCTQDWLRAELDESSPSITAMAQPLCIEAS